MKLAEPGYEDFDMLLDMLFIKNTQMHNKTNRELFKDYVINDLKVKVNERDLDVLLKTHDRLQGKNWILKDDLKAIFERPFIAAREYILEKVSNTPVRQFQGTMKGKTAAFDDTINERAQN